MPVTARLSKLFYDRLGEEIAQELVDWFNTVDATYRANLRELNELNFARFDAKVGDRLAELRMQFRDEISARLIPLEARMTEFQVDLERRTQTLRTDIQRSKVTLVKWMFAFWAPTALTLIALLLKR